MSLRKIAAQNCRITEKVVDAALVQLDSGT
jgi:hypothetical protein